MRVEQDKYFIKDIPEKINTKLFLKKWFYELQSLKYKLLMNLSHPNITTKKYNVAVCAIFKNEAIYLKEWLEFNHLVGVEHFFLYNNNSDDDFQEVLAPYIKRGWVTLEDWPYKQKQIKCYMHCITNYAHQTKWLGFIDIDEFIVPKSTCTVYDFLKNFENRCSVNIYWRLFGTSGLIERDLNGLVCEEFTVCWPKFCNIGKCFYNTAFGFDFKSDHSEQLHHRFWGNWNGINLPPVNIFDHVCVGNRHIANDSNFPIQINHYFTKSYKEYAIKRSKGDVYFKVNPHDEDYFFEHEQKCTSNDYSAYKYLIKLKLAMGECYNGKA